MNGERQFGLIAEEAAKWHRTGRAKCAGRDRTVFTSTSRAVAQRSPKHQRTLRAQTETIEALKTNCAKSARCWAARLTPQSPSRGSHSESAQTVRVARHVCGAAATLLSTSALAAGKSSANFAIPRDALNAGVGDMASANFVLNGSIGDSFAGATSTAYLRISSGFRGQVNAPAAVLEPVVRGPRKVSQRHAVYADGCGPNRSPEYHRGAARGGSGHTIVFTWAMAPSPQKGEATGSIRR